jgi:hypothetical protein
MAMNASGRRLLGVGVLVILAGCTRHTAHVGTVVGAGGSYRFTLAPGSYVVTGCADATVVVIAGHVDHQDISCPIP